MDTTPFWIASETPDELFSKTGLCAVEQDANGIDRDSKLVCNLTIALVIEKPEHWTQGVSARDTDGEPVRVNDTTAVCWCLVGAADKVMAPDLLWNSEVYGALVQAVPAGFKNLSDFNDNHTHAEVLAAVDKAIKEASC